MRVKLESSISGMEVERSVQAVSRGVNGRITDAGLYSGASLYLKAADFHTHCQLMTGDKNP